MTSSLVGSEMCIRDSCKPMLSMSSPEMFKGHFGAESYVHFFDIEWMEAVSYTHLTLPTICSV
eukprot:3120070-Prorocentrum_lima.AAC.1